MICSRSISCLTHQSGSCSAPRSWIGLPAPGQVVELPAGHRLLDLQVDPLRLLLGSGSRRPPCSVSVVPRPGRIGPLLVVLAVARSSRSPPGRPQDSPRRKHVPGPPVERPIRRGLSRFGYHGEAEEERRRRRRGRRRRRPRSARCGRRSCGRGRTGRWRTSAARIISGAGHPEQRRTVRRRRSRRSAEQPDHDHEVLAPARGPSGAASRCRRCRSARRRAAPVVGSAGARPRSPSIVSLRQGLLSRHGLVPASTVSTVSLGASRGASAGATRRRAGRRPRTRSRR